MDTNDNPSIQETENNNDKNASKEYVNADTNNENNFQDINDENNPTNWEPRWYNVKTGAVKTDKECWTEYYDDNMKSKYWHHMCSGHATWTPPETSEPQNGGFSKISKRAKRRTKKRATRRTNRRTKRRTNRRTAKRINK
jgi:hypothetical protein